MIRIKNIDKKHINLSVEGNYEDIKEEYQFLIEVGIKEIKKAIKEAEEKLERAKNEYKKL